MFYSKKSVRQNSNNTVTVIDKTIKYNYDISIFIDNIVFKNIDKNIRILIWALYFFYIWFYFVD